MAGNKKVRKVTPGEYFAQSLTKINAFYLSFGNIKRCRKLLKRILSSAFSSSFLLKKSQIFEIRRFHLKFQELLCIAFNIDRQGTFKTNSVVPNLFTDSGHIKEEYYCAFLAPPVIIQWNYLPRFLSKKEFSDPFLVFSKMFALKSIVDWIAFSNELLEGALSESNVVEFSKHLDGIMTAQVYLFKLLEASFLLTIREKNDQNS